MAIDLEKEIEAAVKELGREGRSRLGTPPTAEQLLAYARGELTPEEQDRVEELLAYFPESVKELLELKAFPYSGDPQDPDYLTDQELDEDWMALRTHLGLKRSSPPARSRRSVSYILPWAAVLLFAVGLSATFVEYRKQVRLPLVNVEKWELQPDDRRKGISDEPFAQLPSDTSHYFLTLHTVGAGQHADYRAEIVAADNDQSARLWQRNGLRRNNDDTFFLWLPRAFLNPGSYRIRLMGVDADGETLLATYTVRL